MSEPRLTHVEGGDAHMVDVSAKPATERVAVAAGRVRCDRPTFDLIAADAVAKGDVLGVARVAGVMAAKRTAELIPLCHPLPLTHVEVEAALDAALPGVRLQATARCVGPTGVEMEALTAVAVAALTIVDMAKAADRWMTVEGIGLLSKEGGRSGAVTRPEDRPV